MGVASGYRVRLLGCHTGHSPDALAGRTATILGQRGIAGVSVKGETGELMKTATTSGVYFDRSKPGSSGFAHNRLLTRLAKVQRNSAGLLVEAVIAWLEELLKQKPSELWQALGSLELLSHTMKNAGVNEVDPLRLLYATNEEPPVQSRMAAKELRRIPPAFPNMLDASSTLFDVLRAALHRLEEDTKSVPQRQILVDGIAAAFGAHRTKVLEVHDLWLASPLKPDAERLPKGKGNVTFVSEKV